MENWASIADAIYQEQPRVYSKSLYPIISLEFEKRKEPLCGLLKSNK